jgi:hypothetical protein
METADNNMHNVPYGEVLRISWKIFKNNFLILFSLAVTIMVPLEVASYFLSTTKLFEGIDSLVLKGLIGIGKVFLTGIVYLPVMMAFVVVVEGSFKEGQISYKSAIKKALAYWPKAIGVELLAYLVILGGILALVLPGIFYYVALVFAIQAVILRDKRGWDALYYSKSLVDGRWWRLFFFSVILLLFVFITLIIPIVLVMVLKPAGFMRAAVFYPISAITTPFFQTIITVLFLKLEQVSAPQKIEERKRHSVEGIASVGIFILALVIVGLGIVSDVTGSEDHTSSFFVVSCCTGICMPFLGLLFGLVGLAGVNTRKDFAVIGVFLNSIFCVFFLISIVVGIVKDLLAG